MEFKPKPAKNSTFGKRGFQKNIALPIIFVLSAVSVFFYCFFDFESAFAENDYAASVTVGENTTYYTALSDAFAKANGGTVTLLKDYEYSDAAITATQNMTLDLNGFSIKNGQYFGISIETAIKVTVKDSKGNGKIFGGG